MGNPLDSLPINQDNPRLRALFGLPQLDQPVQSGAYMPPQMNPSGSNGAVPLSINIPPPDPAITNQAMRDFSGLRQYTNQFPRQEDYKPSRLRQILSDVAGAGTGFLSANPMKGYQEAQNLKAAPYLEAIKKYQMGAEPFEERAKIGEAEAGLAGASAQNLYRYLMAQAANERVANEAQKNKIDYLKATAPTPFGPQMVTGGGEGTNPYTTQQYGKQFNEDTGQWEIKPVTSGISTAETFGQREALRKQQDDAAMERSRLAASVRLRTHAQSEANADRRAILNQTAQLINNLSNAQYQAVTQQMSVDYPQMFEVQQVTMPDGSVRSGLGLKKGIDMNLYSKVMQSEAQKYISEKNKARTGAIEQFQGRNPFVVGFTPEK